MDPAGEVLVRRAVAVAAAGGFSAGKGGVCRLLRLQWNPYHRRPGESRDLPLRKSHAGSP